MSACRRDGAKGIDARRYPASTAASAPCSTSQVQAVATLVDACKSIAPNLGNK